MKGKTGCWKLRVKTLNPGYEELAMEEATDPS
jgi:hypothetical protein